MIDYVGDLSKADAELLRDYAQNSGRILEFGAGASTQILASYCRGTVTTVETDQRWIEKTRIRLVTLGVEHLVSFRSYDEFSPAGTYDLIFVDGIDPLRQPFALKTWRFLKVGGAMLFHDTRRTIPHGGSSTTDIQNVCALIEKHSAEIELAMINEEGSNISALHKRDPLLYVDWNQVEGRTNEQIGIA